MSKNKKKQKKTSKNKHARGEIKMKKNQWIALCMVVFVLIAALSAFGGCTKAEQMYTTTVYALERNGVTLHLDRVTADGKEASKQILLTHGVTYSSHEFDIDYEDYSFVRFLAKNGYAVWRLDIAGFGQSGDVQDGFMPDSDYAAEDINAAVEKIVRESGSSKIDLLGWSWGTVTASRYVIAHSDRVNRLVLYAPILGGLGASEVSDAFHYNTWEHAADDFQRNAKGGFDEEITDPILLQLFCSSCWRYDGERSPNGGRRDICVDPSETLIDLAAIRVPTLIVCGDNDPYLDYDRIATSLDLLPEKSEKMVISGGAHVIMYEKPYYQAFRKAVNKFLEK